MGQCLVYFASVLSARRPALQHQPVVATRELTIDVLDLSLRLPLDDDLDLPNIACPMTALSSTAGIVDDRTMHLMTRFHDGPLRLPGRPSTIKANLSAAVHKSAPSDTHWLGTWRCHTSAAPEDVMPGHPAEYFVGRASDGGLCLKIDVVGETHTTALRDGSEADTLCATLRCNVVSNVYLRFDGLHDSPATHIIFVRFDGRSRVASFRESTVVQIQLDQTPTTRSPRSTDFSAERPESPTLYCEAGTTIPADQDLGPVVPVQPPQSFWPTVPAEPPASVRVDELPGHMLPQKRVTPRISSWVPSPYLVPERPIHAWPNPRYNSSRQPGRGHGGPNMPGKKPPAQTQTPRAPEPLQTPRRVVGV